MTKRSAKIIPLPIRQRLVCSECGADGEGTCRCGAPYVPAGQRAAKAAAASPEKSNRAIAEEIGVSEPTVRRARKSPASDDAPDRRTGRDGKSYPTAVERKLPRLSVFDLGTASEEECWQFSLMLHAGEALAMSAAWTREFGKWHQFAASSDLIILAEQAAACWQQLATDLKRRK